MPILRASEPSDSGFTLVELVFALAISALTVSLAVPIGTNLIRHEQLVGTADELVNHLRLAQSEGLTYGKPGIVWFAPYDDYYWQTLGPRFESETVFAPGVHHRDGYLTLRAHRVVYDNEGDAAEAGTIQLQSGSEQADVSLYMGSGLQVNRGVLP